VSLRTESGRRSRKRLGSVSARRRRAFRVKMHHGMGGSAGDRHGAQNPAMQARNGVCDKIENYISELGRWYVSKRGWPPWALAGVVAYVFLPVPPQQRRRGRAQGSEWPRDESGGGLVTLHRTVSLRLA